MASDAEVVHGNALRVEKGLRDVARQLADLEDPGPYDDLHPGPVLDTTNSTVMGLIETINGHLDPPGVDSSDAFYEKATKLSRMETATMMLNKAVESNKRVWARVAFLKHRGWTNPIARFVRERLGFDAAAKLQNSEVFRIYENAFEAVKSAYVDFDAHTKVRKSKSTPGRNIVRMSGESFRRLQTAVEKFDIVGMRVAWELDILMPDHEAWAMVPWECEIGYSGMTERFKQWYETGVLDGSGEEQTTHWDHRYAMRPKNMAGSEASVAAFDFNGPASVDLQDNYSVAIVEGGYVGIGQKNTDLWPWPDKQTLFMCGPAVESAMTRLQRILRVFTAA